MKNRLLKLAGAFAAALALSFVACGGNNDPEEAGGGVVLVTGVSLDKAGLILKGGGAAACLGATVAPAAADNKTVSWSSGNSAVATVVGSGATATVSPVAAGRTNITVTTADGGRVAICTVTVDAAVTGVTVSPAVLDMMIGGAPASLRASVQPANSVSQNVMWLSSAPGIAAVTGIGASATVVPVAAGTATITAVSEADGSKAGTAVVTVRPKLAATYVAANLGLIRNGEFIVEGTFFHDVYIDEQYNAERLENILIEVANRIGAQILYKSRQDYDPQGASVNILIAEDRKNPVHGATAHAHLDKSHVTVHTFPESHPDNAVSTFRVDIDVATCGEISPLNVLDFLIGSFDSDIITIDYRVRGFTRDMRGEKLFIDHEIKSIQDYISEETVKKYDIIDINVYQSNIFHTKMLIRELYSPLQNYLFNTDVLELPPAERLEITKGLREEMIEIFSGTNIYRTP
jgi:S-adenosylmethionine decarboxylase